MPARHDRLNPTASPNRYAAQAASTTTAVTASEAEVQEAAKTLHAWWSQPKSPLRAFLSITGQGGVFWAANTNDRVMRAAIANKPLTVEAMQEAVTVRRSWGANEPAEAAKKSDDTLGLFE